jgi:ribosomal protein S6--L-glutamate ligase
VLEVNASPGLEGIEEASGVDVAGAVIAHIGSLLKRPRPRRAANGRY